MPPRWEAVNRKSVVAVWEEREGAGDAVARRIGLRTPKSNQLEGSSTNLASWRRREQNAWFARVGKLAKTSAVLALPAPTVCAVTGRRFAVDQRRWAGSGSSLM
jgi:hypothetical protein